MTYRRLVLAGWSRRDWLAVAIMAVTAAFIAGTTLMLLATSAAIYDQTAPFDTDTTVQYADGADPSGSIVLPLAAVETADGTEAVVVGIPADAPRVVPGASLPWSLATLPAPPPPGTVGHGDADTGTVTLEGSATTVTRAVADHPDRTVVPPDWYVADVATVDALGRTGQFVLQPHPDERSPPAVGVVVTSAVPFLLAGARDLLETLSLVALAGGVLSGVSVYSLTRMSMLERMRTFFVVRATGGGPLGLLGLVTLRGFLLALVGVGLGGGLGLGTVLVIAAAAAAAGYPTAIDPALTPVTATAVGSMLGMLLAVGTVAGFLAGLDAVTGPPARLPLDEQAASGGPRRFGWLRSAVEPRLLGWRALAPTTASLSVFVTVLLVATAVSAAVAPLSAAAGGTVSDPDAPHLLASRVDAAVADQLAARGVAASPEVLLTQVRDGEPYLVRGVDYGAFARVSGAALVAGRAPTAADEAVIGVDLARSLDVGVGDPLTLGGATVPGVARVRVVGAFAADGLADDQLLVTLPAARHLGGVGPEQVTLVRTAGAVPEGLVDREPDAAPTPVGRTTVGLRAANATANASASGGWAVGPDGVVATVDAPRYAAANATVAVSVTLRDLAGAPAEHELVSPAGVERVALGPGEATTVPLELPVGAPGRYRLEVGPHASPLVVLPADALRTEPAVERVPPNASLALTVVGANGTPVADATVRFRPLDGAGQPAGRPLAAVGTDAAGLAVVETPDAPGRYALTAAAGNRSSPPYDVTVATNATRRLAYDLQVEPTAVLPGQEPTAVLAASNPWGTAVTREVTVAWPGGTATRTVTVAARGSTTVPVSLEALEATGTPAVNATVGGEPVAGTRFAVVDVGSGLAAAPALDGFAPGSALGGAVRGVFGDLALLQWTLLGLAAVMVTGSTATAFAQAVSARRRTVGVLRATGASPWRVLRLVLADAAVVGGVATLLALPLAVGALFALEHLGYLTVFGIRFAATPSPAVLGASAASAMAMALVAAALATLGLVRGAPARLLAGRPAPGSGVLRRLPGGTRPLHERSIPLAADDGGAR